MTGPRIPPQAPDVERTVLGSMLIDAAATTVALEHLTEDSFYLESHRIIFAAMQQMYEDSAPIDLVTLAEQLKKKEHLKKVGGVSYLSELAEAVATSSNIEYYAKILLEHATLRRLISTAAEITTDCFDAQGNAQEILDTAESKIFSISESRIKGSFEQVGKLLPATFKEIELYSKGGVFGVPTGFKDLDNMTSGFQKGDLVIIAGRPSMGKTAFCLSMALHSTIQAKKSVAIFSLEMSKAQIVQRMLCAEARINMHRLRTGTLPKSEYRGLAMAAGPLAQANVFIDDTPGISVLELRTKARRLKSQFGLDMIVIDYLQLMSGPPRSESRQQEISQISRNLKEVGKELDVPVIALSQLSRAVESRTDKRPQLSDLRESGAIEQDADIVMFVYRGEYYEPENDELKGIAEVIIGKQRNGPVGSVKLSFIREYARFENLAHMPEPNEEF